MTLENICQMGYGNISLEGLRGILRFIRGFGFTEFAPQWTGEGSWTRTARTITTDNGFQVTPGDCEAFAKEMKENLPFRKAVTNYLGGNDGI